MYALQWQTPQLLALGTSIAQFFKSEAMRIVSREVLSATVLAGLLTAVALPATVLRLANLLDNEWSVAMEQARGAGEILVRSAGSTDVG